MAAPRLPAGRQSLLALPLAVFFAVFVAAPLAGLAGVSLFGDSQFSTFGLRQYLKFFGDPFNLGILGSTLWLAARATLLALLLGLPLAWIYWQSPRPVQRVLILLIVLPLLTSAVVRTFAWVVILGRQGIINDVLVNRLGWIEAPLKLLYTPGAVVVALAQIEMPLMVLPLITALGNIDPALGQASRVLGAGSWRTFARVIVPLATPGLLAGCLLVFAAAASAFVTQTLVGGGQNIYMPFYIYQQAIQANDYPFAAAVAVTLLVSVLAIVSLVNLAARRSRAYASA